jgi:uncharacterized protein (DUF488 family)
MNNYGLTDGISLNSFCGSFSTIGYEGLAIDDFILRLIDYKINYLVDVRRNPISRKKGFSKTKLSERLHQFEIHYLHCPELGIDSSLRKDLRTQEDRDRLFTDHYIPALKKNTPESIWHIINLASGRDNRVALCCFENDCQQCHRTPLSYFIQYKSNFRLTFNHL